MYINMDESNKIKEVLDKSKNILIAVHKDPDGDAIGSGLGLYNALIKLGYNVDCIIKNPSKCFDFLKNFNKIKLDENELKEKYDTLIVLDCADKERIALNRELDDFTNIIVIDHHITHVEFGSITLLEEISPATCQIVYDFLKTINVDIDKEIAECIYTGILTDTGGFKYSNVTSHTFEIAKEIREMDVDISDITRRVFETMSFNKFSLLKLGLNNLEIIDEKIAYLYLSKEQIDKYISEDEPDIHEGLVNYGRSIEGVEVSIFIRQIDENIFKISLRSNAYVDVSKIAVEFSGGGHIRAAGGRAEGNIEDIKEKVLNIVKERI
ncbi:MAG: bifunctional oligoribonuclease/PAP phosphatase NrnA [Clostridiales bacterium]|nr:bifunctional oligoribonuclease/PAP phosphatase NrnA [Clostridiales bacterium]